MRIFAILCSLAALLPLSAFSGEKESKPDYKEFSRLVHSIVVAQSPKEIVEATGWGGTVPVPPNLRLPNLRKYVKVGDRIEVPHGTWRRFTGKIENPDKNLIIALTDFRPLNDKTYRIAFDVDATMAWNIEIQQWQYGLLLLPIATIADARFTAAIVCDVGFELDFLKFPPEIKIEPKVMDLGLNLVDVKQRGGPLLSGETGEQIARDIKDLLRHAVKASEPLVKAEVNRAIERSLKEGKGTIGVGAMMKAVPKGK